MLSAVKQSIKHALNTMGIEAHRFHPDIPPLARFMAALRECLNRLTAEKFVLCTLQPVFIEPLTGRTLQWDGLFFRP